VAECPQDAQSFPLMGNILPDIGIEVVGDWQSMPPSTGCFGWYSPILT
jgi:hypothetical protein